MPRSPIEIEPGRPQDEWLHSNDTSVAHASGDSESRLDTSFTHDMFYNVTQLKFNVYNVRVHQNCPRLDDYWIEGEGTICEHYFWEEFQAAIGTPLQDGILSNKDLARAHYLLIGTRDGKL
jgi:hypothetical protein